MSKIFTDNETEIESEWLNKVSRTVEDGLSGNYTPDNIRKHIGAEPEGSASIVQSDLDTHKADTDIHFSRTSLDTDFNNKIDVAEKAAVLGVAPLDANAYVPIEHINPSVNSTFHPFATQALMLAGSAAVLKGELCYVYEDPTPTFDGEYLALKDAPTLIGDFEFLGGNVAVHNHAATSVTVVGVTGPTLQDYLNTTSQELIDAFDGKLAGYNPDGTIQVTADIDSITMSSVYAITGATAGTYPNGFTAANGGFIETHITTGGVGSQVLRGGATEANQGSVWVRGRSAPNTAWINVAQASRSPYTDTNGTGHTDVQAIIDYILGLLAGGSSVEVSVSEAPPISPSGGDFWLDSKTGVTAQYYVDSDGGQWLASPNL